MELSDFNYILPEELIAQKPANPKDSCKLMIVDSKGRIDEKKFTDIITYFKQGDVLVVNDAKVSKMKIFGHKTTGSSAEIVLTNKISSAKNSEDCKVTWECRIKTKNPHVGMKIESSKGQIIDVIGQKNIDTFVVSFDDALLKDAKLPNPPYIHRILNDKDYQTVYAKNQGSLASPTAGLHFTQNLLKKLELKGVRIVKITLHVGYGTFIPILGKILEHKMEFEDYEITKDAANTINNREGRLIVVGTTALRALESSVSEKTRKIIPGKKRTNLFITPGYVFKTNPDALISNFHLPKSTLLLLVSAFIGRENIMNAYSLAVKNKYKFFSLGDAMLLKRKI